MAHLWSRGCALMPCCDGVVCGAVTATCQRCLQLHFPKRCAKMAAAARVTPKSGIRSLGDLLFVCPLSRSSGLCFTKCPWILCVLPLLEKSGGALPVALKSPTWCWRRRAASNPEPSKLPQRRRSWVEKLERPWVCSCFPAPLSLLCWGRGRALLSASRSLGSISPAAFCP